MFLKKKCAFAVSITMTQCISLVDVQLQMTVWKKNITFLTQQYTYQTLLEFRCIKIWKMCFHI